MRITFRLKEDVEAQLNDIIEYLERDDVKITPSQAIRWAILKASEELRE